MRVVPSSHKEECAVMDQQRDREQLERKLEQCRRLSGAACDPGREPREYIWTAGGLCNRAVPPSHKEECAVMDQQRDREQLERKLEQCRRLSGAASDPTTSIRFAKLIEELEHSLREAE